MTQWLHRSSWVLLGVLLCVAPGSAQAGGKANLKLAVGVIAEDDVVVTPTQDTVIEVRSAGPALEVYCQYANRTPHCSNTGEVCADDQGCLPGECLDQCVATDFIISVGDKKSKDSVVWSASDGSLSSFILPVGEIPFVGQIVCGAAPAGTFEFPCVDPCNIGCPLPF